MDAKVGDDCIIPRIGKPVEIQAFWSNALTTAGGTAEATRACAAFDKFCPTAHAGCAFE